MTSLAIEARSAALSDFENAQALVGALGAPLFNLIVEVGEWIAHQIQCGTRLAETDSAESPLQAEPGPTLKLFVLVLA